MTGSGGPAPAASPAPSSRKGRARTGAVVAAVALVATVVFGLTSGGSTLTGVVYFTTYQHQGLYKVHYGLQGNGIVFGAQQVVASLPGADGVVFEANGDALVGGQTTGNVQEVNPATGQVHAVASGCANSFLLSLDPSGDTVYTAGLPGDLCAMPTNPLRPGHRIALSGDDPKVTGLAFDERGNTFYTTGDPTGVGNFGVIDLATGTTSRKLSGIATAHGMTYDPYTKTLFLFGGDSIFQIDPKNPLSILSSMTVPGTLFDQGTTDGQGHLFAASNYGQLVVVDVHASGRLGDPRDTVTSANLSHDLVEIAPLVGPGAATTGAPGWVPWVALLFALALVACLAILYGDRLPKLELPSVGSRLPSWDIRHQEARRRRAPPPRARPTTRAGGRSAPAKRGRGSRGTTRRPPPFGG